MTDVDVVEGDDDVDAAGDADPLEGDSGPGELGEDRAGDVDGGGLTGGHGPGVGPEDSPGGGVGDTGEDETAHWADGSVSRSGGWAGALARDAEAAVVGIGGLTAWDMQGGNQST